MSAVFFGGGGGKKDKNTITEGTFMKQEFKLHFNQWGWMADDRDAKEKVVKEGLT